MNKHIYIIIGLLIGLLISGVSAYGAGKLYASSIDVDTSKMSELGETSNVNLALNYLYGKAASITSGSSLFNIAEPPIVSDRNMGVLAILYFNPATLKLCNSPVSTTGTKTGCMKWYIYKEDSSKYYAILDHNTTATISSWSNSTSQLNTDTNSWKKGTNQLTVRLITADEIAAIVGASNWESSTAKSWDYLYFDTKTSNLDRTIDAAGESSYGWLFDYTNSCTSYGCNVADGSTGGYWTSTTVKGLNSYVWLVFSTSNMGNINASNASYGVRPVIEIPKSLLD